MSAYTSFCRPLRSLMFWAKATSAAQVAARLQARRVASSADAWSGVGSSFTCTTSFM
ncbi:hypothetical protein ACIRLA_35485 [Streptomyces sp. NPDC102364]|uniref:hypothetical protein n=1 Tax=Streptomyces sp. NPDC102364 TaxID=3366161 RepID=UPI003811FE1B